MFHIANPLNSVYLCSQFQFTKQPLTSSSNPLVKTIGLAAIRLKFDIYTDIGEFLADIDELVQSYAIAYSCEFLFNWYFFNSNQFNLFHFHHFNQRDFPQRDFPNHSSVDKNPIFFSFPNPIGFHCSGIWYQIYGWRIIGTLSSWCKKHSAVFRMLWKMDYRYLRLLQASLRQTTYDRLCQSWWFSILTGQSNVSRG